MVSRCCLGLRRILGDDDVHPFITLHKGMYLGRTPSSARVKKQILRGDTTKYASLGIISNDIPTKLLKTIGLSDQKIILERIMYDERSIGASRVYLNKIRENQGRSHSLVPGENVDCQEGDTLEIRGQYHTCKFKVDRVDRRSQENRTEKEVASYSEGIAGRDNAGRFLKKRKDQQQARIGGNKRNKSPHDTTPEKSSRVPPTEEEDGPESPLAKTPETDNERELHQDDTNAAIATAGMFVGGQNQDGSPKAGATENTAHTATPQSTSNEVDPPQEDTEENAGGRTGDDGGDNNHPRATTKLHGLIERQKIVEAMQWLDDPIGIRDARTQNILAHDLPIHSLIPLATIGSEEHKKACFDLMSKLIDVHQDSLDHPNKKGMIPVQYAEYLFVEKKFIDLLLIKAPHTKRLLAKSTALVAISSRDIDLCYHTNERCNCNARFFEKKARHLTKVDANSMNKELNYAVRTTLKQNKFVEERLTSLVDKSKNKSVTRSFLTDFLDEYHESRSKTDKVLVLCDHEGDCAKCNLNHPIFTSKAEWNSNNNALDVNVIKLNRAIGKCKDLSEHLIAPEKIEENVKEALVTSFFASTQVTSLDHQKEVDSRKQAEETIEEQKKEVSTFNDERLI
ncbi:hypothetical protein FRACYDRAFT_256724 [Fragilariopsis cylindrus CCMP1102]|uniref:Uncharacterized protein n=1 Tax=Fragilariopsis cylindrus CCMP1102 TaxID=635003 RepID=A0A1E7EJF8_9STRA|nr:hypothetical protein FRACYDRAFT_256724 [Fragilariopsis cylindrus CCMP1102]|eukprot:OEU06036.1 hypothetical protein FRACYDRAFT_256724 [Fragilariopsis cylindrus CCMP1102]